MNAIEYAAKMDAQGSKRLTIAGIARQLKAIGYRLNRSMDCRSICQRSTGETYPTITTGIVEADTGLSFANVNARRDANFRALQDMRYNETFYAIHKDAIFSL